MIATLLTTLMLATCAPCSTGAQCIAGQCQFSCQTNADCQRGLICGDASVCELELRRLPGQPPTLVRGDATHPERFRYGGVVPPGYRLVSEANWGTAAGGIATFAGAYLPFAVMGTVKASPLNLIPLIGPILAYRASGEWFSQVVSVLGIGADVVAQLAGVTKFIVGLAAPKQWLETISFAPTAPGADVGASVVGRF